MVGGVVATADSGPLRHRYGAARDLVVGMTVALSDGTIARVDFYMGIWLVGSATSAPYIAQLPGLVAGNYAFRKLFGSHGSHPHRVSPQGRRLQTGV